jgi:transcription termination/antitermination protein NusG
MQSDKPSGISPEKVAQVTNERKVIDEEMHWYVLKVQSNRERTIRESLLRKIAQEGLGHCFGEIVIPVERVVENKSGKKRVIEQKLYPGYLMIQMRLTDDSWYLVRTTAGVGDFTGGGGQPMPMQEHEIQRMLGAGKIEAAEPAKVKIAFGVGESVKITDGPFDGFDGQIEAVDEHSGKITVLIEIFGRPTPVDLESWQVEAS